MSLLWGREAAIIDAHVTSQPDPRHCPICEDCDRYIGHCNAGICALDDDERQPQQECYCECPMCRHSEAPYCTDTDSHKTCQRHRQDYEEDRDE